MGHDLQRGGVLLGSIEALVIRMLLLCLVVFPCVRLDQVRQHLGEAQAQLSVSRRVASLELLAHFLDDAGEFIGAGVAQRGHSLLHSGVELGGLRVQAVLACALHCGARPEDFAVPRLRVHNLGQRLPAGGTLHTLQKLALCDLSGHRLQQSLCESEDGGCGLVATLVVLGQAPDRLRCLVARLRHNGVAALSLRGCRRGKGKGAGAAFLRALALLAISIPGHRPSLKKCG